MSLVGILRKRVSCEEREETGNTSEGAERDSCHGESSTYEHDYGVPPSRRLIEAKVSKRVALGAIFCTLVLLLPIVLNVSGSIYRQVSINNLPYEEPFAGPDYVMIDVVDISQPEVLAIYFHKIGPYSSELTVDSESYGSIDEGDSIFVVPAMANTRLEFYAFNLWTRIERVGPDRIVNNTLDNVTVKGKTYPEEYQRIVGPYLLGHRAMVAFSEGCSHTLEVDLVEGLDLNYIVSTGSEISAFGKVMGQTAVESIFGARFVKISSDFEVKFRLEMAYWKGPYPVIEIPSYPNIEIASSDIYFSDDTPGEGDTITITTVVHNTGNAHAENFTVGVYLDYITNSSLIGETNISLKASKSTPLEDAPSFEWDTTGVYGTHMIHILLDKPNLVEEWNESNHAQRSIFVDDEYVDQDSDSDGLPNYWESEYGLDPYSSSGDDGAQGDPDNDNLVNIREYENRTDPTDSDTDDDMFLDGNNNTFVRLKLENLTIDGDFDPPNGTESYYIRMHRYVLDDENSFPYSGYRIPASGYFNPPNASVANLTISYIVEGIPLEVYHPNIADPIASFSLYINKSGLSSGSPTYFNLTNENVTLNVSANRVDFAFYDPDPTVEDADWDGVPDVWEIIYFDTRTMDCREMDSDSDQHPNVKDMDSDNDYATESMEIRLYHFPLYGEEAYNYSVYMYPVYEFDDESMTPKYRYPVFAIQGANLSESVRVNISDTTVQDTDNDGLLDGYEILDYFLKATDPDTDDDGLEDGQEVNSWFFFRNESIGEYYFDRDSFYHLNMSEYHYYVNPASDRYSFTVYGATETNQTSAEDIEDALNITYYALNETGYEVPQRIEYSADYDSGNLTANFTEIDLTISFNISPDGHPSVGLDIAANGTVMGHSSDLRLKLNYSVISVRGTIGWMNDTDWDGILDGEEVNCSLSPWSDDSDNDGIWDQAEIDYWHYDKGLSIQEARARANLTDYDGDGLFDGYEVMWSLDPTNEDPDGDGLTDYDEVLGFIPTKRMEIERSVLNDGNFSESFSALSSDRFSLKLLAKGYINRSKSQYDEDTIDIDYYVGISNDLFMENNCNLSILLEGEPLDIVTFTTGGTISQRKEDNSSLNVTESRYFLVFGRLSSSSYDVHFEMNVTEDNASVNLSFHTLIVSREGLHPFEADFDHDSLNDGIEVSIGSSPFESDSDEDGLSDWDEYIGTHSGGVPTDPTNPDTDGDGVWDGYTNNGTTGELTLGTSALDVDTDDDGLWDGNTTDGNQGEQTLGTNATNPDTDGDTMPDGWEVTYGLPPTVDDGDNDTDDDGMSNAEEYAVGTDPSSPDTEGDNLTDKEEIYDVLYRTNVTDGAINSDSYINLTGEKWIYCNVTEWKTFTYTNDTAQTEGILTNDSWNQQYLRVHDDLIVWQDDRNENSSWDIYAYNMSTENLTRISSSNSSEMIPDVWKNVVVWQDSRNDNTTGWDIYMFDLSTENETRITNSSDDEIYPRVDSGWIVWLDDRHANPSNGWQKEVYAYNIENEQEMRITEDEYDQSDLEMDSGRLVWMDESLGSPNVVLYDLGKTRSVTSDTKNKRNPDIDGNWIVWEQYDAGNWDIYALDITRWFKTKVVSEEHDQINPSVHGGIVVWEDKRNGNPDIYSMNLTTRFETRLTDDPETERRPVIFSSLYIWEEQNGGTWDVHFYDLEPVIGLEDYAPVRLNSESGDLYVWTQSNGFARFIESNTTGHVTSPMPEKGFRNKEIYSGSDPFGPDTDGDGLLDGENVTVGLNSSLFQFFDSLGIPYFEQENDTALFVGELSIGTDCLVDDTDNDDLDDGEEIFGVLFEIFRPNGTVEKKTIATIPTDSDFDDDGLIDGDEKIFRTDPEHPDTDLDSLIDGANMTVENGSDLFDYLSQYVDNYIDEGDGNVTFVGEMSLGANPVSNESDGDGVLDEDEVFTHGTDPSLIDTDGDGMNDGFELHYDFDPLNSSDSDLDLDCDGSKNIHEFMYGTNPDDWDTDDDGLPDGWEQAFGMNALDNGTHTYTLLPNWTYEVNEGEGKAENGPQGDLDQDGVTNAQEYEYMIPFGWNEASDGPWWSHLIPSNPDTDSDGLLDGSEWFPRVYWFEAEDFVFSEDQILNDTNASCGRVAVHDDGGPSVFNGTSFSRYFPSGTYRLFVKGKAIEKENATLEISVDNPDQAHRLVSNESQLLKTHYDWNGTDEFEVNESAELRIWINDTDYYGEGDYVYLDQIMLVRIGIIEETTTSDSDDIIEFDGGGEKTVYISLTLDPDIPLYVSSAWMTLRGWKGFENLIENGGFETGSMDDWTGDCTVQSVIKHSGSYAAKCFAPSGQTKYMYQEVDVPENAISATLQLWDLKDPDHWPTPGSTYTIKVRDENGTDQETLFSSDWHWSPWQFRSFNLTSYVGETIQIYIELENPSGADCVVNVDDVKLRVLLPSYPENAYMNVGDSANISRVQWMKSGIFNVTQTTLDLSGEMNRYISLNLNSSMETLSLPLTFHSDTTGRIEIVELQVVLEPFVSTPFFNDTDSDNLTDPLELDRYTSSLKADSDNDGWTDHYEIHTIYNETSDCINQTSPVDSDTDDDLDVDSEDNWPTIADIDRDGLLDGIEEYLGTNASDPDTDDDGLLDGLNITVEVDSWRYNHFMNHSVYHFNNTDNTTTFFGEISFGTNPISNDTDLDGLHDGDEIIAQNSTDPLNPDTDSDFLLDGSNVTVESESDPRHDAFQEHYIIRIGNVYLGELGYGTNPSSSDSDEDSLPDGWEVRFDLDPADNSTLNYSKDGDPDNDELSNIQEFLYQTHPWKWDTDNDSLPDAWETQYGLDPLWNNTTRLVLTFGWEYDTVDESGSSQAGYGDLDQDQLLDIDEFRYNLSNPETYNATTDGVYWNGTSPSSPDTDGDGLIDGSNRTIPATDELFQQWTVMGIEYTENDNGTVTFVGETDIGTDCLSTDTDGDGATDGQEVFGYTVIIAWYESGELETEEKTVYGDPLKKFLESDGTTLMDVDGDTIPDRDEADPWNSTDYGYYVNHPDVNETDVQNQFNPSIKENTPPKILNVKIDTKEKWEWVVVGIILVYICTHAWTEVSVEVIDVANFTVEIRIDDYKNRFATFEGKGHSWFDASLDLDYFLDVLLDYTVKISAEDANGNVLDPPFVKKIEGLFGGIISILTEAWDWLVGIATAIFEAVVEALNFIVDLIVSMFMAMVDAVLKPVFEAYDAWVSNIGNAVTNIVTEHSCNLFDCDPQRAAEELAFAITCGGFFYTVLALSVLFQAIAIAATAFLASGIGTLGAVVIGVVIPLAISLIIGVFLGEEMYDGGVDLIYEVFSVDDPFWGEGVGLGILALMTSIGLIVNKHMRTGKIKLDGDLAGLFIALIGVFIQGSEVFVPEEYGAIPIFVGLALSVFGCIVTLVSKSGLDASVSPFKYIEETVSGVGVAYALTSAIVWANGQGE